MAAHPLLIANIATLLLAGTLASCGDPAPATHTSEQSKPAAPAGDAPKSPAPKADSPKSDALKAKSDPMTTPANPTLPIEKVTIAGKTFKLELAATDESRHHGLSGRTDIPEDGGMLFVFPARSVQTHGFVMRDCPVPIDIIYLDVAGRVVNTHKMVPEPPRSEAEKVESTPTGYPAWFKQNAQYEARLKQYSSRYPSQFVIELKGDTLDTLKVKNGDKIALDLDRLKKLAK
jgi:uncharacterized protein